MGSEEGLGPPRGHHCAFEGMLESLDLPRIRRDEASPGRGVTSGGCVGRFGGIFPLWHLCVCWGAVFRLFCAGDHI